MQGEHRFGGLGFVGDIRFGVGRSEIGGPHKGYLLIPS